MAKSFEIFKNAFVSLGEHPRIGVLDVCPFIPVRNVAMEDCIECAREFAARLALELNVPGEICIDDWTYPVWVPGLRIDPLVSWPDVVSGD